MKAGPGRTIGAALALAITACGPGASTAEIDLLLDAGKSHLANAEWSEAQKDFRQIVTEYADRHAEAHFGLALAEVLTLADTLNYVADVVDRSGLSLDPAAVDDDESRYLIQLVSDAIERLRAKFAAADTSLAIAVEADTLLFRLSDLSLSFGAAGDATIELSGEWDRADALLLQAFVRTLLGLLNAAASVDIEFDFPRAYAYYAASGFDAGRLSHLMGLATYILNDPSHPNFLGAKTATGTEAMDASRRAFASAFALADAALVEAAEETDPQDDDLLRFSGAPGFLGDDPCEQRLAGTENLQRFSLFGVDFGDGRTHPAGTAQLRCLLRKLAGNLDASAPSPIQVLTDLLPVVDALVAALSRADARLTFGLPVPEGLLEDVAGALLGDSLALDPGRPFRPGADGAPFNLRQALPRWTSAGCGQNGKCRDAFLLEMECASAAVTSTSYPVAITFDFDGPGAMLPICRRDWFLEENVVDSAHFGGDLEADGMVGLLPYVAWGDPSLHGLVILDLDALADAYRDSDADEDREIVAGIAALPATSRQGPANALALNAWLAALSSNSTVRALLFTAADWL